MFNTKTRAVREGLFAITINGEEHTTPDEIARLVRDGTLRVVVPIDRRVSPWAVPKLFALSQAQAIALLDALMEAGEDKRARLRWVLRSDGTVSLTPNGDFNIGYDFDRLPHPKPPPLPGSENPGSGTELDDAMPGRLAADSSEVGQ